MGPETRKPLTFAEIRLYTSLDRGRHCPSPRECSRALYDNAAALAEFVLSGVHIIIIIIIISGGGGGGSGSGSGSNSNSNSNSST